MMDRVMEFARRRRTLFATLIPLLLWIFGDPALSGFAAGMALILFGQAIRIWSAGYISKNQEVATGGPYGYVRNPLYFGSLFISLGFAAMTNRGWAFLVIAAQFLFFYYLAILSEERYLLSHLGEAYHDYYERTPRFWPTKGRYARATGVFDWKQVGYNREYRSFVPVALLCLLFAAKALHLATLFAR